MAIYAGSCLALPSQLAPWSATSGLSIGRRHASESGVGPSIFVFQKLRGARCSATSEKSGSRSSNESSFQSPLPIRDFYELLGVPVYALREDIRQAYRNLQKKHHPDIVGREGHAMTLLLNEAYQTLMDDNLRAAYNVTHSYKQSLKGSYTAFTGSLYSSWVGPDRPQGIFVDENVCVGCRECVHVASNTFTMDENTGCARVKSQWGDSELLVKTAREVCPVNCIHLVEREDLAFLEYLIRPQLKSSNGIYGGGWERPRNVFMAAATLKRQMEEKKAQPGPSPLKQETPAQKKARMEADFQLQMGPFWKLWSWAGQPSQKEDSSTKVGESANEWPWKGLFGRSSTKELLTLPISEGNIKATVELVQDWALTFASSSELPLPMPFRTDLLANGVQLSLITASNGTVSSIGCLMVTVDETLASQSAALGEPSEETEKRRQESYFRVRREGTTGTGPLPGEGRIVKALKSVVLGQDSDYKAYHIPRR